MEFFPSHPSGPSLKLALGAAWFSQPAQKRDHTAAFRFGGRHRYFKLLSRAAHAWATPSPTVLPPDINAQPPFSTNAACSSFRWRPAVHAAMTIPAIRPVIVVPATNDSVAQRTEFLGARFRVEAEVWSKQHRLLSAAGRPQFLRPSPNMAIAVARYKRTAIYIQHASANRCARTREQAGQSRMFHRRATDVALDGFNFSTVSLARS
jgi:hypothetical protein